MSFDFESEGLLEGCEDDEARDARLQLLRRLADDGASLDELKRAVAEERLVLLPAERALGGPALYTLADAARRAGIDEESLLAHTQALGMPRPASDERALTDDDVEAARRIRQLRDAGLPEEGMLEVSRVIGQAMANVAASSRQMVGEALLRAGDTELDLGVRYGEAVQQLTPLMRPTLEYLYRVHLREGIRRDAVGRTERESGRPPGAQDISVAFADLVGFTRLGEQLSAADLGHLAGRLAAMAGEVAEPPVRLVKTIGDAAMLVSPDPEALVAAVLDMVALADAEADDFPQLRAGLAAGPALNRVGDWYGRPVNLASRITSVARPGSVLAAGEVRKAAADSYRWSRAPARHFKGIEGRVALFRARRMDDGSPAGATSSAPRG